MSSPVFVIGHKNPDTDAICAAIGYAEYLRLTRLPEAEAKKLLQMSLDAGWAGVIATSPQHGPKLRQLMAP